MDFVIDFLTSWDYNAIFVYMDYLTKYTKLTPCFMRKELLTAERVVLLFFKNVIRCFDIPKSLAHNRDLRFTSGFWQYLLKQLISRAIATLARHPEANS